MSCYKVLLANLFEKIYDNENINQRTINIPNNFKLALISAKIRYNPNKSIHSTTAILEKNNSLSQYGIAISGTIGCLVDYDGNTLITADDTGSVLLNVKIYKII